MVLAIVVAATGGAFACTDISGSSTAVLSIEFDSLPAPAVVIGDTLRDTTGAVVHPVVRAFNFKGGDQQKKVGMLSGGERNRVHLAKMLKSGANLLLLDEPTNDLDVDTLRALEEALLDFPGCAVIISHDRWFLDRIATHVLAFEGDSQVTWFEGNFEAYEAWRRERLGEEAERPHRITYRKLVRS